MILECLPDTIGSEANSLNVLAGWIKNISECSVKFESCQRCHEALDEKLAILPKTFGPSEGFHLHAPSSVTELET